ncbi:MAG TPA: hypothetical protein VGF45_01700, partial [Polyangia bacterium]
MKATNKITRKTTNTMTTFAAAAASTLALAAAQPAQAAQTPDVASNVAAGTPPPAPPPPPYSLPFQLRPVTVGNVLRSDTTMAFYENAKGEAGESVASMLLASYKLTPDL